MCRFVAYLGPRVTLSSVLIEPEHSLLQQASQPLHQTHGRFNGDGFGAGWYDTDVHAEPARYRSARPMWTDRSFASVARVVTSTAIVAAVRSATPGFPIEESGSQPFTDGSLLFVHNGAVDGFRDGVAAKLRLRLSERAAAVIEGAADSEVLFALTLDAIDAGASFGEALGSTIAAVNEVSGGRLNMALCDGRRVAAAAWGNSLFTLQGGGIAVIASEPYDDRPGWRKVDDRSLVTGDIDGLGVAPL